MENEKKERELVQMWVYRSDVDKFDSEVVGMGMKQIAAASRLFDWFMAQDDTFRRLVLQLPPAEYRHLIAKEYLSRVAGKDEDHPPLAKLTAVPPRKAASTPRSGGKKAGGQRP